MTQAPTHTEKQIVDLETRIAHQDHAIHELGNEVYQQQKQIEKLERQLSHLAERMQSNDSAPATSNPADEIPPHY